MFVLRLRPCLQTRDVIFAHAQSSLGLSKMVDPAKPGASDYFNLQLSQSRIGRSGARC